MGITYSASNGTRITSPAMTEALPNQSQQSGNNTVVVSDTLGNIGGGQIGDGTDGVGDTYAGRLIVIDQDTADEQIRLCVNDAAGTGTTRILTVNEDWDVNPVATTDSIHVAYEFADIENGGAGGGVNLNSKSGLWEFSNTLEVQSTGMLATFAGQGMELDDQGSTYAFQVQSGGFFYSGYPVQGGGANISGSQIISYNNATGEPTTEVLSGGHFHCWDTLIWAQRVGQQFDCQDGGEIYARRSKFLFVCDELILYDCDIADCAAEGLGATTDIIRFDAGSVVNGLVVSNVDTLDSRADTVSETIELEGVLFTGVTDFVNMRNNKIWNLIDPIWSVTAHGDLVWIGSTSNELNDRRSVKATVKEADGTLLQDALVIIHEETQLADLVLELVTDSAGYAEDSFIYRKFETNSTTTTYGGHALRVDKWLYNPFAAAQTSDQKFNGEVVLSSDPHIVQTTQATAISQASGITWNDEANPSSLIAFTGGAGTLSVGDTVTASPSGADGIVVTDGFLDGDSVAGTVLLRARDANAFANADTLSNGSGWTANYTSNSEQEFSIRIDANAETLQDAYDYWAARSAETTLNSAGEILHEWGRDQQARVLYTNGTTFTTERSNGKGVIFHNYGTGNVDHFTDDAGNTYVPPVTVTIEVTAVDDSQTAIEGASCYIKLISGDGGAVVLNALTNSSGVASASYSGAVPVTIDTDVSEVRHSSGPTPYDNFVLAGQITSAGYTQTAILAED